MKFRTIAFALVPFAVLVLLGEFLAQIMAPDLRGTTYFQTNQYGLKNYVEDRDLFWKVPNYTEKRIAAARSDRNARMLITLGGSIAQGTSPGHFTALLKKRYSGQNIGASVHNLALAGYTTHQSRVVLEKIAPPASPRIVLVCHGFNDSCRWWKLTDRDVARANHHWSRSLLGVLNHSRMFAWARHIAMQIEARSGNEFRPGDQPRIPLEHYRENLTAIAQRTAKQGGVTILLTQAMPSRRNTETVRPYFDVMAEIAAARTDTYLCDVRPAFMLVRKEHEIGFLEDEDGKLEVPMPYRNRLFVDGNCHVTDEGYSLMADAITRVIDENHLLEGR